MFKMEEGKLEMKGDSRVINAELACFGAGISQSNDEKSLREFISCFMQGVICVKKEKKTIKEIKDMFVQCIEEAIKLDNEFEEFKKETEELKYDLSGFKLDLDEKLKFSKEDFEETDKVEDCVNYEACKIAERLGRLFERKDIKTKSSFKSGDLVRFKTEKEFRKQYELDEEGCFKSLYGFTKEMYHLFGKKAVVYKCVGKLVYLKSIDASGDKNFAISDEMLVKL